MFASSPKLDVFLFYPDCQKLTSLVWKVRCRGHNPTPKSFYFAKCLNIRGNLGKNGAITFPKSLDVL